MDTKLNGSDAKYKVVGENRGSKLMVQILGTPLCFCRNAHELFSDKLLLKSFSCDDAYLIAWLAGAESEARNHAYIDA